MSFNNQKNKTPTVLLVGVNFGESNFDPTLNELGCLAETAGLKVHDILCCNRKIADSSLFVGSGKAEEIKNLLDSQEIDEVLFDQALSPSQQRNLERFLGRPVNDRTYLILEIFAQRARSYEGKLQVELARLQYLSTRLVRRWSHLERQQGGIGTRGGPGETQIELDRRMIDESIKRTKERLKKVMRQRNTQRKWRERSGAFNISLVGYTNAGKSTLFNTLVKAGVYEADQLFATLDTTTRQLFLGEDAGVVYISDTVGFIRDLPHGLINAFKATLQETIDADLLLHVVDASSINYREQMEKVYSVLEEIGANQVPQFILFNKCDALDGDSIPKQDADFYEVDGRQIQRIFISAKSGLGMAQLRMHLAAFVRAQKVHNTSGKSRGYDGARLAYGESGENKEPLVD